MAQNFPTAATTSIVSAAPSASINDLVTKTIMCWVNPRSLGGNGNGRILNKRVTNGWTMFLATVTKINYRQNFTPTEGLWTWGNGTFALNTWTHVALSYDNSNVANNPILYSNGVALTIESQTSPVGTITLDSAINFSTGNVDAGNRTLDGFLDDPRIYNRILTPAEILTIYNCQGMDGIVNGLVGRWPSREAAPGTTISGAAGVKDVSLNKNNAAGTNSPLYSASRATDRRRTA